jgi:hypothetical protein
MDKIEIEKKNIDCNKKKKNHILINSIMQGEKH